MGQQGEVTVSVDVAMLVAKESVVRQAIDFVYVVALDLRPGGT